MSAPTIAHISTGAPLVGGSVLASDGWEIIPITAYSHMGITGLALRSDGGIDLPSGIYEIDAEVQPDPHRLRLDGGGIFENVGESLRGVYTLTSPDILYVERDPNRTILNAVALRVERSDP